MLIDWFTVIAQSANFLILVWLMKRYLYQPILTAIDAREARIAAALKDAAAKQVEAARERDDFQQKNEAFELRRDSLLTAATNEVNIERQRLLDEARKDSEALRTKLDAAIRNERDMLGREVVTRVQQEVFAITRQTLSDLATVSIEAQLFDVFIDRLRTLDGTGKAAFATALKAAPTPVLVRSAFGLPTPRREEIQQALKEIFGTEIPVSFDTAPSLVCGIELSANGQKLVWSIDDYLTSLNRRVSQLLAAPVTVEGNPDTTTEPAVAPQPPAATGQLV